MVRVAIAGDFVVPKGLADAKVESGDYSCLSGFKSFFQSVDYSIVNFESPVVVHDLNPIKKAGLICVAQRRLLSAL